MKRLLTILLLFSGIAAFAQDPAPLSPKTVGVVQFFTSIEHGDTVGFVKTPYGYLQVVRPNNVTTFLTQKDFIGLGTFASKIRLTTDSVGAGDFIVRKANGYLAKDTVKRLNQYGGFTAYGTDIFTHPQSLFTPVSGADIITKSYFDAHPGNNIYNHSDSLTQNRTAFFSTHSLTFGDTANFKATLVIDPTASTVYQYVQSATANSIMQILPTVVTIGTTDNSNNGAQLQTTIPFADMQVQGLGNILYDFKLSGNAAGGSSNAIFTDNLNHRGIEYASNYFPNSHTLLDKHMGDSLYAPIAGTGFVTTSRQLTINGVSQNLTADRTWNVGTVTSVTGTTNRITSTGGTTPVIDISASYVGQSSITTIGTLSSGSIPYSLLTGTPTILTAANPTATAGYTFVNGSAPNFMRSDAAPKLDSAVVATSANHPTLAQVQTKLNGYILIAGYVVNETPSGTINSSNTAFSIANTPVTGDVQVFRNGMLQISGTDYTQSGTSLTYLYAPTTGDNLKIIYIK